MSIGQKGLYYDPSSWLMKLLRFLGLLETGIVRVSHTGMTMWITSLNNAHSLITSVDPVSVGGGIMANIAALWAHTSKRKQILNAKAGK